MAHKEYYTKSKTNLQTIAFYNVENLFDTEDDPYKLDNDFLPEADKKWTLKRYEKKIYKIGTAISNIGFNETRKAPAIIGLAEVVLYILNRLTKEVLMSLYYTKKNILKLHIKNKSRF